MSNSFLLESSVNFSYSDVTSDIHQSMIDLSGEEDEEIVKSLLNKAIRYLEKYLEPELAIEIFSLIPACFLRFPVQFLNILNELLNKSKNNSNYIISTASVLSCLSHVEPNLDLPDFSSFVSEALKEILEQIQSSQQKAFTVFKQEIHPKFGHDLVIDLLLSSKLTENLLTNFLPYVCSQIIYTKNPKFAKLVHEITKNGFVSFLDPSIITDKDLFARLSSEDLTYFIPLLTDQIFKQIFPEFERTFYEETDLNPNFIINLLDKCDKLNLKLKQIEKIFEFLKPSDFTSHVIDQLKKYDFVIPNEYAVHFADVIDISSDTFVHLKQPTAESKETVEFDELSIHSMKKLYEEGKFNEIIEKVVFSSYPPNNESVTFLLNFINLLSPSQVESFYSIEQNRPILLKILDKKVFPPPKLLNIIDSKTVIDVYQNGKTDQNSILLLYSFAFCREQEEPAQIKSLDNITVFPPKNDNLLNFIEKNEIEKLTELDNESLSLASCALILADQKAKNVCGLTKECILQFYAIALNHIKNKNSIDYLIESPEIEDALKEGCMLLKNSGSNILNTSINSILSKLTENELFVKSEFSIKILNILIEILIQGEYRADKSNLYKLLFMVTNKNPEKLQIKDKIKLIQNIISDVSFFSKFSAEIKLNLKAFQLEEEIKNLFLQKIQNQSSTKDEIINTLNLIQNYVINTPTLKFESCEKVQKISEEVIKSKNWDELFIICDFFVKNSFITEFRQILNQSQIPPESIKRFYSVIPIEERTADEFISLILSAPDVEAEESIFDSLYKKLILNESITIEYLKIILNRIYRDLLTPEDLLKKTINLYKQFGDTFIKAFDCIRVFNPANQTFLRRHDYKYKTFSNPEFVNELITKLFTIVKEEPDKYQVFFILKNIAESFPFFFDENPIEVFNSVLPAFNYYSLINEDDDKIKDEVNMNKIKSLITAMSFTASALHSTTVLDFFSDWIFQNISKFTFSQIICFCQIIISILKSNMQLIFMSFVENYMNVIEYLLKRDDLPENGPLRSNYYSIIFELIIELYNFDSMGNYDWLVKSELKSKNRPFYYYLKYHSAIYPNIIKDFEITIKNEVIKKYRDNLNKKRPSWICSHSFNDELIDEKQKLDFMNHYKSIVKIDESLELLPVLSYELCKTEKMIRHAISLDMWIYEYFFRISDHPLLPRYQKIIEEAKSEIDRISNDSHSSGYKNDRRYFDMDKNSFSQFYSNNASLFKAITEMMFSLKEENQTNFYSLLSVFSKYEIFIEISFESFTKFFENIEKECNNGSITLTTFNICLLALRKLLNKEKYRIKFNILIGIKLYNMSLQPQYRTNDNFLIELSQFLLVFNRGELSIKVTHIIGFMLLSKNKEVIKKALILCSKFSTKDLQHLGIIQDVFDRELCIEKYTPSILITFCNFYPDCINARKTETLHFIKELFVKYKDQTKSKSEVNELGELIFTMMSILAPDRNEFVSFSMSDSSTIEMKVGKQKFSFQPIPSFIWDSNPYFWKLFDDNRSSINEIIQKQSEIVSSFKLFTEFPELFDFKLRIKYFRDKMSSRIDDSNTIYLTVKREDILNSSYNTIKENIYERYTSDEYFENDDDDDDHDSDNDDDYHDNDNDEIKEKWLNEFDLTFDGEAGIDSGGLTRDWLTNLLKKLFDPGTGLFIPIDKGFCYQPKSKKWSKKKLKYFKFAGQIVARAIVEGLCIDTHLSLPFIKQILHRKVCFDDLQNYDVSLYKSFKSILDTDIDSDPNSEYYFEATEVGSNGTKTVQLKYNGSNIKVTNENKKEFVDLIADYYLSDSISDQIKEFSEGFDSIIPHNEIRIFTASEFELVACGVPEINVEILKKNFIYEDGYTENTPAVVLFFNAISKWSQENLAKLLLFFTATSNIPADGITKEKLVIGNGGGRENFPIAHTCYNKIDLPRYETEDELNEKFMLAINIESFGRG